MKPLCDYHIHTTFSDGKNTPEEMVLAAIEKGVYEMGFSDHSYTFFDDSYTIQFDKIAEYKREIARLKEKYKGKIKILCGVEQDYYSRTGAGGYDYAIGSVHSLKIGGQYLSVDEKEEKFVKIAEDFFGGDYIAFAKMYFDRIAKFAKRKEITIIGHFDLIAKYNKNGKYFNEKDEGYIAAWKKAVDKLIAANKTFEINTGSISRGFRAEPYPSDDIRAYIKAKGGNFVLSSDCHRAESLCFGFEKYVNEI